MFDENQKNIKALAYEKSIDVERVFKALEDALATAARKYYKTREPMETVIDRASGEMTMYVIKDIVDDENEIEDPQAQWTLDQARKVEPDVEVGGTHPSQLHHQGSGRRRQRPEHADPHLRSAEDRLRGRAGRRGAHPADQAAEDFGRIAAQSAKQVLYQKVREAEREKVYNEFIGKLGELENGYVKRFERGDMIIDLNGKTEGIIPRSPAVARRALLAGRPHQGRHRRRAHAAEGTAGRPLAHRSASAHQALRDGSAGDLRRHGRHQAARSASRASAPRSRSCRASATSIRSAPASA